MATGDWDGASLHPDCLPARLAGGPGGVGGWSHEPAGSIWGTVGPQSTVEEKMRGTSIPV